MEEQLLVTWKYDDDDQDQDCERDILTGSKRSTMTSNETRTAPTWRRWSKRISKYWENQQRRQHASARPDSLEYDFVAPTEKARTRLPHRYDEKTVRLAPDGDYYLRNRYKQKV
jgi:hypothetical protein